MSFFPVDAKIVIVRTHRITVDRAVLSLAWFVHRHGKYSVLNYVFRMVYSE